LVTCCRRFFRRREREVAAQWLQAARVTRSTALNRVDGQRETVERQGTLMDYSKVKYGRIEVEHKRPTENLSEKKKRLPNMRYASGMQSRCSRIQSSDPFQKKKGSNLVTGSIPNNVRCCSLAGSM
jgi:hypothetical protein